MPRIGRRPGDPEDYGHWDDAGRYLHGPKTNGWKQEPRGYWSDDPLLAWKGACSHGECRCEVYRDEAKGEMVRTCLNKDCPWGLPGPPAEKSHLEKRFAGIDFG